jgi:hypothetical protein
MHRKAARDGKMENGRAAKGEKQTQKLVCVPIGAAGSSGGTITYGIVPSVAEEFLQHHYEAIAGDNDSNRKSRGVSAPPASRAALCMVPPLLAHIADSERSTRRRDQ